MKWTIQVAAPTSGSTRQSIAIAGIGTPKLVRVRVCSGVTNGADVDGSIIGAGWCNGVLSYASGISAVDNATASTADTNTRYDAGLVTRGGADGPAALVYLAQDNAAGTVWARAHWDQWITDGFDLIWHTFPPVAILLEVTFYTDCVVDIREPATSSSINGTVNVSAATLGFDPHYLEAFHLNLTVFATLLNAANARLGVGFAIRNQAGTIQQIAYQCFHRDDPGAGNNLRSVQDLRDDSIAKRNTLAANGTLTEGARLEVTALGGGSGYTLTTRAVAEAIPVVVVAIRFDRVHQFRASIETFDLGTSGPFNMTGVGFRGSHIDAIGTVLTAKNAATRLAGNMSLGAAHDPGDQAASSIAVADNVGMSNTKSRADDALISVLSTDGTSNHVVELVGFEADGPELNVTVSDTVNRVTGIVILGDRDTFHPDPVELELVVPAVARLVTLTPAAGLLPFVVPAVARTIQVLPAPVPLAFLVATPARLVTLTPSPVLLPFVVPAVTRLVDLTPSPVELELVVAAVARLVTLTPSAVLLPFVVPAVTRLGSLTPSPVLLPFVVPAVMIPQALNPSPVLLPFVVPTVARLVTLTPSPVVLLFVVPVPVLGFLIVYELDALLQLVAEMPIAGARAAEMQAGADRGEDLRAAVARADEAYAALLGAAHVQGDFARVLAQVVRLE